MQNTFDLVFEKKTDRKNAEYFVPCKEFKDEAESNLAYKGLRFVKSNVGLQQTANFFHTIDVLASTGDRRFINVDNDAILRTDYALTSNQADVGDAGTIYSTESARSRQYQTYDRVDPVMGVVYLSWDELKEDEEVSEYMACFLNVLTPNQADHYLAQIGKDTNLYQNRRNLSANAATTFDFSVLATQDGEHLYEYVAGAKFSEQVVSILKVVGPFSDEYDVTRETLSKKECIRWLAFM